VDERDFSRELIREILFPRKLYVIKIVIILCIIMHENYLFFFFFAETKIDWLLSSSLSHSLSMVLTGIVLKLIEIIIQ